MQNQTYELIPIINKKLKRDLYDHNPVKICEIIDIINNIPLKIDKKMIKFFEEINNLEYEICLHGLLGICSPNTCIICKNIKNIGNAQLWNKWISIASSKNNIINDDIEEEHLINKYENKKNMINDDIKEEPLINKHENKKNINFPPTQDCVKKTCFRGISCDLQNCQYLHPGQIPCKYGDRCTNPTCHYYHIEKNKQMTQIYMANQNYPIYNQPGFQVQPNQNYPIYNQPGFHGQTNNNMRNFKKQSKNNNIVNKHSNKSDKKNNVSNLYQDFV